MPARALSVDRPWAVGAAPLWIALALLPGLWALVGRPVLPIDETRYLTVAWEMWLRGDFLVPHLNGVPYSHKPPVLFWLIQGGWWVFGVNEWWPRLLGPLATLAATGLSCRLASRLWPLLPGVAGRVPWLLAGALGWLVFGQMLMFDMLLTVATLAGIGGIWMAARENRPAGWWLIAGSLGAGLLIKGPVVFIHVLVPAVLAPLWSSRARLAPLAWLGRCLLSAGGGIAIVAVWALPAARAGGPAYADAILWGQTAGRMVESFAHARGVWFYLLVLPAMLLPWSLRPGMWRRLARAGRVDQGGAFVLTWLLSTLGALTLVSGKQPHYLLPLLPAAALLLARGLGPPGHDSSGSGRLAMSALATVVLVLAGATVWFQVAEPSLDLRPAAAAVAALEADGVPVAVLGHYKGQLGFLGRLRRPLPELAPALAPAWAADHADGWLILFGGEPPAGLPLSPQARFPYRRDSISLWRVDPSQPVAAD